MILRMGLIFALIIGVLTMVVGFTIPLDWGPKINLLEVLILPGRFIGWVCIWGDNGSSWQRPGETTISTAVNMLIGFVVGAIVGGVRRSRVTIFHKHRKI